MSLDLSTLDCTHDRAQQRTSVFMPGHTNLAVTSFCVAGMPEWEIPWRESSDTSSHCVPVEVSQ